MIVAVEVDVALGRPPRVDRTSYFLMSARTPSEYADWWACELEAMLDATAFAAGRPGVIMAVGSRIVEVIEA